MPGECWLNAPVVKQGGESLQILTVTDLLDGKTIDYPRGGANRTLRRAPRLKETAELLRLDLGED